MSDVVTPAVLVVDDTHTSLLVLERAVASEGYRTLTAGSGEEAIEKATDPGVFLVLMDVIMPGIGGFAAAEKIRASQPDRRLPIIFLTALDQESDLTFQGYEAGAVDFLYKPVKPHILRSKVQVFYELYSNLLALAEANQRAMEELRERKRMEQVVQESEVRYRSLLELSPVSIIVETNGRMSYINTAVLKLLGEDDREKVARFSLVDYVVEKQRDHARRAMQRIVAQGGRAEPFETELLRANGSRADVEVYGACVVYEGVVGIQMALQDITERKRLEAEWRRLSRMDGLTGIFNRRAFDEIITRELRRAQRNQKPLALIMIDIDAFKLYNDKYGHQLGDETLRAVANALEAGAVRGGDHVARYGGEEFAVIMADTDEAGAVQVAEQLRQSVESLQIEHGANPAAPVVTISMGVYAAVPDHHDLPGTYVHRADRALYRAKHSGRNRVVTYEENGAGAPSA
jgi:two-component system cell cycle response regulator